jgi:hypothetical protein
MMNKVNWTAVVVISIIALFVLMVGASLLGGWGYGGWGYGPGWGMMGPWMMGGMSFMWLIPLGFLVLTVLGIAWLVRTIGGGNIPPTPAHPCPSCGRGAQADWKNCPYCGTALAK